MSRGLGANLTPHNESGFVFLWLLVLVSRLRNTLINLGETFCQNLVLIYSWVPSFLRKQESSLFSGFWTPAIAGVTSFRVNKPVGSIALTYAMNFRDMTLVIVTFPS